MDTFFEFNDGMPRISAAAWLQNKDMIATGHYDGHFIIWNLKGEKKYEADFDYEIHSISVSSENRILLGTEKGDIYLIELGSNLTKKQLFTGNDDKFSRTWRLRWVNDHSFIRTSTYGILVFYKEVNDEWERVTLPRRHTHSIFSVDSYSNFLATGEWTGKVIIWVASETSYIEKGRIMLTSSVEDILWRSNGDFIAVTSSGHIYYIEKDSSADNWYIAFDVFMTRNKVVSVAYSTTKGMLVAVTRKEVIQLDLSTQQIQKIPLEKSVIVREISPGTVDILTQKGVFRFNIEDITVPSDFVKYKFAKISLLGRTGVGKSTLCDAIIGKNAFDEQSTFGKKIWEWEVGFTDDGHNVPRKLVFHDHGGQESEMFTFIPYISDSSSVLLLFKRPDLRSFEVLQETIPEIIKNTNENTKYFLVETHIDQQKDDIGDNRITNLIENYKFIEFLKVSSKTKQNLNVLKTKLLDTINWDRARIVFESIESNNVLRLLFALEDEGTYVQTIEHIQQRYKEKYSKDIAKTHLQFLISNYSAQGIVEYYRDVSDFVVFGGPAFQKLRSDVPAYANEKEGLVSIRDIAEHTKGNPELLKVIDALFEKTGVHIKCGDSRIYPNFLTDKPLRYDKSDWPFNNGDVRAKKFANQSINQPLLINALSDLDLKCYGVTKNSGLFGWGKNAYIYYSVQEISDILSDDYLAVNYVIGGAKSESIDRLSGKVESILKTLFGHELDANSTLGEEEKKKFEHDIVVTYASEQEVYVKRVCKSLKEKGIDTWCAPFEQNDMWGKNLNKFLESMYFSKGKMCIMFISDDYVKKVWPQKEARAALSRSRQDPDYLLPVRFEHTLIPGLDPDLHYYWNWNYTPTELSDEIEQKLEGKKKI